MLLSIMVSSALAMAPQDPPAQPAPIQAEDQVEDIVVQGAPIRQMVREFVREVITAPAGQGLARWNRAICVGVANLDHDVARTMIDRVSDAATAAGVPVGEEGCEPNVLIIWTNDGPGLATRLVERRPLVFMPAHAGGTTGRAALRQFQTSEAAVRWWHVSVPMIRGTDLPAVQMPWMDDPPMIPGAGRTRTAVRSDLQRAFVIVDVTRTGDADLGQISDYVAMVVLAQIDPDADLRAYPTILNLFSDVAVDAGLTDWDRSWLAALYAANLNQRGAAGQAAAVGGLMYRDQRSPVRAGDEGEQEEEDSAEPQ